MPEIMGYPRCKKLLERDNPKVGVLASELQVAGPQIQRLQLGQVPLA